MENQFNIGTGLKAPTPCGTGRCEKRRPKDEDI
jgi:hypothetical protein